MRLGLHPSLDPQDLTVGQLVAVSDQMLVVDALGAPDTGEAVTLEEVLDSHRALVTTGSGATRVLRDCLAKQPADSTPVLSDEECGGERA